MPQERISANQFYSSANWHEILLEDSVIGCNVLNYALRYHISLDSIMNTDIKPRDVISDALTRMTII